MRVALATGLCVELEDLPPALLGGYAEALVPAVRDRLSMRAWGAAIRGWYSSRCGPGAATHGERSQSAARGR